MNHEELTPEEQNLEYLRANPAHEQAMWADWVLTVCGWQKIDPPTDAEWKALRERWHHEQAPLTAVGHLKRMRAPLNSGDLIAAMFRDGAGS